MEGRGRHCCLARVAGVEKRLMEIVSHIFVSVLVYLNTLTYIAYIATDPIRERENSTRDTVL